MSDSQKPTSSTATTNEGVPPPAAARSEAHDRAVRFGLVFTQLGAASKEEVFPHGVRHMPRLLTLKEVTEGKLKRQSLEELDAKIRSTRRWWWPFGWFGPPTPEEVEMRQREALRRANDALRKKAMKEAHDKALQVEEESKLAEMDKRLKDKQQEQQQVVEAAAAAPVSDEPATPPPKPKLYPLKVDINPRALTDEEVASLTVNVANQRLGILESEKEIHSMMDTIEKTRMQYLRISQKGLKCETEVVSVLQCYEDSKMKSVAMVDGKPTVVNRAAALKCGPNVEALEKCAVEVAKQHVRE